MTDRLEAQVCVPVVTAVPLPSAPEGAVTHELIDAANEAFGSWLSAVLNAATVPIKRGGLRYHYSAGAGR